MCAAGRPTAALVLDIPDIPQPLFGVATSPDKPTNVTKKKKRRRIRELVCHVFLGTGLHRAIGRRVFSQSAFYRTFFYCWCRQSRRQSTVLGTKQFVRPVAEVAFLRASGKLSTSPRRFFTRLNRRNRPAHSPASGRPTLAPSRTLSYGSFYSNKTSFGRTHGHSACLFFDCVFS